MALLVAENWEGWDAGQLQDLIDSGKYISANITASAVIEAATGLDGGKCLRIDQDDLNATLRLRPTPVTAGTGRDYIRWSTWIKTVTPVAGADNLIQFCHSGSDPAKFIIQLTGGGHLNPRRWHNSIGSSITSGSINVRTGSWVHIELELRVVSASAHADNHIKMWVDGVLDIDESNIDLADNVPANYTTERVLLFSGNDGQTLIGPTVFWDDEDDGSGWTGQKGKLKSKRRIVDATVASDFSVTGAATDHEAVDDAGHHDGATSYIEGTTIADEVELGLEAQTIDGTIEAVMVEAVAALAAPAASRNIKIKFKSSATTVDGDDSTTAIVSENYQHLRSSVGKDPNGDVALTESAVDAMSVIMRVDD